MPTGGTNTIDYTSAIEQAAQNVSQAIQSQTNSFLGSSGNLTQMINTAVANIKKNLDKSLSTYKQSSTNAFNVYDKAFSESYLNKGFITAFGSLSKTIESFAQKAEASFEYFGNSFQRLLENSNQTIYHLLKITETIMTFSNNFVNSPAMEQDPLLVALPKIEDYTKYMAQALGNLQQQQQPPNPPTPPTPSSPFNPIEIDNVLQQLKTGTQNIFDLKNNAQQIKGKDFSVEALEGSKKNETFYNSFAINDYQNIHEYFANNKDFTKDLIAYLSWIISNFNSLFNLASPLNNTNNTNNTNNANNANTNTNNTFFKFLKELKEKVVVGLKNTINIIFKPVSLLADTLNGLTGEIFKSLETFKNFVLKVTPLGIIIDNLGKYANALINFVSMFVNQRVNAIREQVDLEWQVREEARNHINDIVADYGVTAREAAQMYIDSAKNMLPLPYLYRKAFDIQKDINAEYRNLLKSTGLSASAAQDFAVRVDRYNKYTLLGFDITQSNLVKLGSKMYRNFGDITDSYMGTLEHLQDSMNINIGDVNKYLEDNMSEFYLMTSDSYEELTSNMAREAEGMAKLHSTLIDTNSLLKDLNNARDKMTGEFFKTEIGKRILMTSSNPFEMKRLIDSRMDSEFATRHLNDLYRAIDRMGITRENLKTGFSDAQLAEMRIKGIAPELVRQMLKQRMSPKDLQEYTDKQGYSKFEANISSLAKDWYSDEQKKWQYVKGEDIKKLAALNKISADSVLQLNVMKGMWGINVETVKALEAEGKVMEEVYGKGVKNNVQFLMMNIIDLVQSGFGVVSNGFQLVAEFINTAFTKGLDAFFNPDLETAKKLAPIMVSLEKNYTSFNRSANDAVAGIVNLTKELASPEFAASFAKLSTQGRVEDLAKYLNDINNQKQITASANWIDKISSKLNNQDNRNSLVSELYSLSTQKNISLENTSNRVREFWKQIQEDKGLKNLKFDRDSIRLILSQLDPSRYAHLETFMAQTKKETMSVGDAYNELLKSYGKEDNIEKRTEQITKSLVNKGFWSTLKDIIFESLLRGMQYSVVGDIYRKLPGKSDYGFTAADARATAKVKEINTALSFKDAEKLIYEIKKQAYTENPSLSQEAINEIVEKSAERLALDSVHNSKLTLKQVVEEELSLLKLNQKQEKPLSKIDEQTKTFDSGAKTSAYGPAMPSMQDVEGAKLVEPPAPQHVPTAEYVEVKPEKIEKDFTEPLVQNEKSLSEASMNQASEQHAERMDAQANSDNLADTRTQEQTASLNDNITLQCHLIRERMNQSNEYLKNIDNNIMAVAGLVETQKDFYSKWAPLQEGANNYFTMMNEFLEEEKKALEEEKKNQNTSDQAGKKESKEDNGVDALADAKGEGEGRDFKGYSGSIFSYPITGGFGEDRGSHRHNGIDYGAPTGTPLPATEKAIVDFASGEATGGYGNLVVLKGLSSGKYIGYAHLDEITVRAGQEVNRGDLVGRVGNTGHSFGSHLHFMVGDDPYFPAKNFSVHMNPLDYLAGKKISVRGHGASSPGERGYKNLPIFRNVFGNRSRAMKGSIWDQILSLVAMSESGGDIAIKEVAPVGGNTGYGKFQITYPAGGYKSYISWLGGKPQFRSIYNKLSKVSPDDTKATAKAWADLAKANPRLFERSQDAFILHDYYLPIENLIKDKGTKLKSAALSMSVLFGQGGATSILKNSGALSARTEAEALKNLYNYANLHNPDYTSRFEKETERLGVPLFKGKVGGGEGILNKILDNTIPAPFKGVNTDGIRIGARAEITPYEDAKNNYVSSISTGTSFSTNPYASSSLENVAPAYNNWSAGSKRIGEGGKYQYHTGRFASNAEEAQALSKVESPESLGLVSLDSYSADSPIGQMFKAEKTKAIPTYNKKYFSDLEGKYYYDEKTNTYIYGVKSEEKRKDSEAAKAIEENTKAKKEANEQNIKAIKENTEAQKKYAKAVTEFVAFGKEFLNKMYPQTHPISGTASETNNYNTVAFGSNTVVHTATNYG